MELYYNIIILFLVITNLYCFIKWTKTDDLYTAQLTSSNLIESQRRGLEVIIRRRDDEIQELRKGFNKQSVIINDLLNQL